MKARFPVHPLRMIVLQAALLTAGLLSGGCVYTQVRMPRSREFRDTHVAGKQGEATVRSVAWLVSWGDAGLQKAAENGGLETLAYADVKVRNILFGLYLSNTTVVYGQ